jgi:endonuclease/exonuclease/phosphatase (EEP) superfamily protein YafD
VIPEIANRQQMEDRDRSGATTWPAWTSQVKYGLLTIAAFFMGLALVATYLARWGWLFEMASHFRVHIVVGLLGIALLFMLARQWPLAGVTLLMGLAGFSSLAPFYFGSKWVGAAQSDTVYRALALNVHYHNDAYEELLALVEEMDPDFIVLSEATQEWQDGVQALTIDYPYTHYVGYSKHGRIIYSRFPFVDDGLGRVDDWERPSVVATLDLGEAHMTVVGLHVRAPMSPESAAQRNRQMANLAQFVQAQSQPTMLLGDFNITPWSPVFHDFMAQAGLKDARIGHGLAPTWPTHLSVIGIPIDHALVSPGITIHKFQRGPHVGSDHYPIIVDFSVQTLP